MKEEYKREHINCPCCNADECSSWAEENSYQAVKCSVCGFVYVNPRPNKNLISEAVITGVHKELETNRTAIAKREGRKVNLYKKLFLEIYSDLWENETPIKWLDVGAGYGEIIESLILIAPKGSDIMGIEPMKPKVEQALKRGLNIQEGFLNEVKGTFDVISLINIFSHIPNFDEFLIELKEKLNRNGELFLETGNIGDLKDFKGAPSELDLPDHLTFAGEKNVEMFLTNAGFEIVSIKYRQVDGLINFLKNIIKKIIGRKVSISIPYTSKYRTLLIRAKLIA